MGDYVSPFLRLMQGLAAVTQSFSFIHDARSASGFVVYSKGFFPLARQRLRECLIEVYKVISGIHRVDSQNHFLWMEISNSRGHFFRVRWG